MNRTGFFIDSLEDVIASLSNLQNLLVEGMYSHLSSADDNKEYTKIQIEKFTEAKKIIESHFKLKYIHLSASSGILNYPDCDFNAVRPGLLMYGFNTFPDAYKKLALKPIATLKSKITFIKELPKGSKIGYSGSYELKKNSVIATVPIGYADGMTRAFSNNGFVVINDSIVPIVGKICMDSFMVDVSNISAKVGDDVYIWDNKNISLEAVSARAKTINYEILCRISSRVPRIFID